MPERSGTVRIFVDPGDYTLGNLGDVAMLQVALRRLRAAWEDSHIDVLVRGAALEGAAYCGAHAVPYQGMADWFAERLASSASDGPTRPAGAPQATPDTTPANPGGTQ